MLQPWRIVESRVTFEDRWIKVRSDTCLRADGAVVDPYHVFEYPNWVNTVPITRNGEIVLVREYRHGWGEVLLGLPSGTAEPGDEDIAAAGARELREETGYEAEHAVQLGWVYANPASHNNVVHQMLFLGAEQTAEQQLDPNEEIEVVLEPFAEFYARIVQREIGVSGHAMATVHSGAMYILRARPAGWEGLAEELLRVVAGRSSSGGG